MILFCEQRKKPNYGLFRQRFCELMNDGEFLSRLDE